MLSVVSKQRNHSADLPPTPQSLEIFQTIDFLASKVEDQATPQRVRGFYEQQLNELMQRVQGNPCNITPDSASNTTLSD
eukprot:g83274.t1